MTTKKKEEDKAKTGPKSVAEKQAVDKKLRELYYESGITYTRAAIIAGCGPEYSTKKFKEFADEILKHREDDEDWLEKNDRVRERALEGLAVNVEKCDDRLGALNNQMKSAKQMQVNILPNACEKLENETGIRAFLKSLDSKEYLSIYTMMNGDINMWKNYGYYIQTIGNNIRAETTLKLEIQQQYDTIEIMPPPSEILNKMIEQKIAEKQGLTQPVPDPNTHQPKEKPIQRTRTRKKVVKKK